MEDRRTAFAIVLSIIVVMMYSQTVLTPPPSTQLPQQQSPYPSAGQGTVAQPSAGITPTTPPAPSIQSGSTLTTITADQVDAAGSVRVRTPVMALDIFLLGARLRKLTLSRYAETLGSENGINLVEEEPNHPFPLGVYTHSDADGAVLYAVTSLAGVQQTADGYQLEANEGTITFTGTHPNWGTVSKTFRLNNDGYLIGIDVTITNRATVPLSLEWSHYIPTDPARVRNDPWIVTLLDTKGSISHLAPDKVALGITDKGILQWAALGDRYFQTALISKNSSTPFALGRESNTMTVRNFGTPESGSFLLYAGPKDQQKLKATGFDLHRTIDLGFFTFLADPLLQLLRFFHSLLDNYGLAIILLTLVIKLVLYPLTAASFKSMQKMQEVQPEVEKLRAKYKDATELNHAMMELYKNKGVNPLGGCLPMFAQIPVFLGLYNALLQSIELRHQPFAFWITDLSSPEKLILFGIPIPLMIVIMGATMIWQQWTTPSSMDPQQKKIMMMMPVIFTGMFIIFPMPAGLVLYWLINNITSITQQIYLKNAHGTHPMIATLVTSVVLFVLGFLAVLAS